MKQKANTYQDGSFVKSWTGGKIALHPQIGASALVDDPNTQAVAQKQVILGYYLLLLHFYSLYVLKHKYCLYYIILAAKALLFAFAAVCFFFFS